MRSAHRPPPLLLLGACFLGLRPASTHAQCPCPCPGDLTGNTLRDAGDIEDFVRCLLNGPALGPGCACADLIVDSAIDLLDLSPFVDTILAPVPCSLSLATHEPGPMHTPSASPCPEGTRCDATAVSRDSNHCYYFSGEFYHEVTDLRIEGRGPEFIWARKYRSRNGPDTAMGNGWDFSYNIFIEGSGADRILHDGNTRADLYILQSNGKWGRDEFFRELEQNGDTTYTLRFADAGKWNFRSLGNPVAPGRIASIIDRNGNTISFAYDGLGRLVTLTDTLGRSVTVTYNADGFISTLTDFTGRQVVYSYYQNADIDGAFGDLKSVRGPVVTGTPNGNDFPAGKTTVYTYSKGLVDNRLNHNLLTITDPKGQTYLQNVYASTLNPDDLNFDRLLRQTWGHAGDLLDIRYFAQAPCGGNNSAVLKAIVNDRVGNVREYFYDSLNRLVLRREFTGRADPDRPTTEAANRPANRLRPGDPDYFETRWSYNADALPTLVIHPNQNSKQYIYELTLDANAPRRFRGNLRQVTRNPGPLGGDQASISESYTYETGFGGCGCGTSFVKTHTDGRGNVTTHSYDAAGNRTQTVHRPGGGVEDWTYNAFGQVLSHTLPANCQGHRRVDSFAYYAAGPQAGYLQLRLLDSGGFNLTETYEYDARGNVTRVVDPRGNDSFLFYNSLDQRVRVLSRSVGGVRYETLNWFDANDNLVRTDVENRDEFGVLQPNTHFSTIHEFDILNRRVRLCRERGNATLANNQLACADIPPGQGVATEYAYDAVGNRTLVRSPEAVNGNQPDNVVQTLFDERNLVFKTVRAPGSALQSTWQYDYDGNGNPTAGRAGLESTPHLTVYAYDGYDRRLSTTDPMGNVRTVHYDANSNRVSTRIDGELVDLPGSAANIRLGETTYLYDAMDRRIRRDVAHFDTASQSAIGDGQSTTQWTYADNSQECIVTDDIPGHTTTHIYDTANRTASVTDAKGNSTTYSYDANSNTLAIVEIDKSDLGNPDQTFTTQYAYDALNRVTQTTDNLGNTHQYDSDSRDNRTLHTDARNNRTRYEYDGLNRLILASLDMDGNAVFTDPADIVTQQNWDDNSRLISRTDDNNHTTLYAYDALNRRVSTDHADCTSDSADYDVHDSLTATVDANGTQVAYQYDLMDRLTFRTITTLGPGVAPDTSFESYQYDGLSRRVRAEDDDSVVTRAHDSLANRTTETQQIAGGPLRTVAALYDAEHNQTRLGYPGGRTIVRTYDLLDRPFQVRDDPPLPGSTIATYFYRGPYRVERFDFGLPAVARYQPTYDAIRRITRTLHTRQPGGAPIDDRTYSWDRMHNRLTADNAAASFPPDLRTYGYDAANRLVASDRLTPPPVDPPTTYQLDGAGNRLSVGGPINPGPYTLDPTLCVPGDFQMNQYTATPFGANRLHDENGNLTNINSGARTFTYDCRDRLVQTFDAGSGQTTTYRYDAFGRRIEKNVAGTITRFYYDGPELIEEQDAANATLATYVYSKGFASRLQMVRAGQKYFYHVDDLVSVRAVTNSTGTVVERYDYGDYGAPNIVPGGAYVQPPGAGFGYFSDLDPVPGPQVIADDFTLTQVTNITSLRWWGFYQNGLPADNFSIVIFNDAGGQPGAPIYQAHPGPAVNRTSAPGGYQYDVNLAPAFLAQAGVRYWIEVVNNLPGQPVWAWRVSTPANNAAAFAGNQFGPWNPLAADMAFALNPMASPGNPFLFHGHYFDGESGLYWSGERLLATAAGRFIQRASNDDWWKHLKEKMGAYPGESGWWKELKQRMESAAQQYSTGRVGANSYTYASENPASRSMMAGRQEAVPSPSRSPSTNVEPDPSDSLRPPVVTDDTVYHPSWEGHLNRFPEGACRNVLVSAMGIRSFDQRKPADWKDMDIYEYDAAINALLKEDLAAAKAGARADWKKDARNQCVSACAAMSCPKAGRDTCTLVSVWGEPEMLVNNDGDGFWFASAYGEATCECSCVAGIQCRR